MKLSTIYTRTGDEGLTGLVGGKRVKKTNARIEAYGTVDELSAQLGLLASWMKDGHDKDLIIRVQRNLFTICSSLATEPTSKYAEYFILPAEETNLLEQEIDMINGSLPSLDHMILSGGTHQAAFCHVCRTVCRRAERRIFFLHETSPVQAEILHFVNRLSDYLFVLARKLNFAEGVREKEARKPSPLSTK
ncbi:MAG: cob(I)yrinic acid a,c-diamide adenosyltransferase [Prevotella sp.]|jgi:cob(I)alamin adenosyltransferase|nr:cob(I)yrinic acid a,c-diamide adenosyltransferase [Prevotella sp.]MBQ9177458.1 cob(I)yrinic acid a,c-diamide adenosyltransferase [Prevotella sp.]MBQ9670277.1 cob(I)yrinic acid a,c-diamide adenosyltransferase [Prevotella sp.]MBR1526458.1 cob(I)yrinic acid a,c-diamide adenosyltransferase [Prevotella sp.]MDY6408392.1 cob(I)yrinic acid a,c-diamide adenosyltransferase [Prevotella sp.]